MNQIDCMYYSGDEHCQIHGSLKNPILNCSERICKNAEHDKPIQEKNLKHITEATNA